MEVDGIDKADIFDEYFDDTPKLTNYEKIKNMSINEMAEIFNRKYCEECAYKEMNFDNWKDCDVNCWANPTNEYYKKWLESEE